jgi:hypothetical protein
MSVYCCLFRYRLGPEPFGYTLIRMCEFFSVVLSCVGRGLAMGLSPLQGILPKCLNRFMV